MRYSFISAAVLALVSTVVGQEATAGFDVFTAPMSGQQVVAGKPFDITWVVGDKKEWQDGTATIALLQGSNDKDLRVGETVAAGVKNSLAKYTWTVPANAGTFKAFGLRITLDNAQAATTNATFQYSFPFQIVSADQANTGVTTTVQLGTGTAYTPEPTTTSTRVVVVTNSTSVVTSTTASVVPTNSSNFTMTGTATLSSTRGSGPSPTTSRPPAQTTNAAVANAVSGGLVVAGALAALFL